MDMPSRIEIRRWLAMLSRDEILANLETISAEHGKENEQDVRDFLNHEREQAKKKDLLPAGEASVLNEHEQRKADIAADFESRKRLYGDADQLNAQDTAA